MCAALTTGGKPRPTVVSFADKLFGTSSSPSPEGASVDEGRFSAPGLKILYFLTVGVVDILQIVIESGEVFWLEII